MISSETVGPIRTTSTATLSHVVAVMPAFLTGASGVFLRRELGFDEAGLGLAIAVFMAAAALSSVLGGRLSERIGAGNALMLGSLGNAFVLLGIGTLATEFVHLVALLAVGGMWNGVAVPATSLALARGVALRPALSFGIKQSAIPVATLLAGASVPLVGLTLGWRWVYVLGAALAGAIALSVPRRLAPPRPRTTKRPRDGDAATAPMAALAVASGVGMGAAVALGGFLVEALAAQGMSIGGAGWLLMLGSVVGIASRMYVGWLSDRHRGRALYTVSAMLAIGAVGYGFLAAGMPALLIAGTLLAFACGWGWPGLLVFATVQLNPNAPAAATGIIQSGTASGAALGPLVFGYVVTTASYATAWALAATAALVSAIMIYTVRLWLVHDRHRRAAAG